MWFRFYCAPPRSVGQQEINFLSARVKGKLDDEQTQTPKVFQTPNGVTTLLSSTGLGLASRGSSGKITWLKVRAPPYNPHADRSAFAIKDLISLPTEFAEHRTFRFKVAAALF